MRISDWSSDVCSSDLIYGSPDAFTFSSAAPRSAFPRHDPGYGLPGPLCSTVLCRLEGEVCDAAGSICDLEDVTPGLLVVGQDQQVGPGVHHGRSGEHTSELQSLMRSAYAVFCLKQK